MKLEVLKIRNTIYCAIDVFFKSRFYYEVVPPMLTSFSCENACVGGSDLISVNYYGQTAFLSQSGQMYLEALAMQLGKVYCIAPAFRAESTSVVTHLSEFWMCEAELLDVKLEDLIRIAEDLLITIIRFVLNNNYFELKSLGVNTGRLDKIVKYGVSRITYNEAITILNNKNVTISWGEDITFRHEEILSEYFNDIPYIITLYPKELSSFYKKICTENQTVTLSFDLFAPNGYGEIIGGSIREDNKQIISNSIKKLGIDVKPYEWYLNEVSSSGKIHGGFGMGIERLISWICGLQSIQDAIPYPRMEGKVWP